MGHGARGAQGRGRRVGVEVGLGGEVGGGGSGGQVGVHSAVAGAVVREGVWSLGHRGSDVGLLPSVAPGTVGGDVLLSLEEENQEGRVAGAGHTHAQKSMGWGAGGGRKRRRDWGEGGSEDWGEGGSEDCGGESGGQGLQKTPPSRAGKNINQPVQEARRCPPVSWAG